MSENEILGEFKHRRINTKTNNYIFCETEDFTILEKIPKRCSIYISESNVDIEFAQNIKIDLKEVMVKDILSYTLQKLKELSLLDVTLDYTLKFHNKFDLLKFQNVLHNYGIVVQMIFYNVEELDLEDQRLFNEIYYFNSIFFNANSFINDKNFKSYFLSNERVLDNRENYTKIKMINNRFDKKSETIITSSEYVIDDITKDCRTCQNMSCRVEQNEKPIADCFGYINHEFNEKEKQLVKTNKNK